MEGLLIRLHELKIEYQNYEHPAVTTVEQQAQQLGPDAPGALTKNLFLKDKKGRLYIVTALVDTKVNLQVLSARLGVGKGGVRLAPDELIATVLQVPLGSVTPLAAAQPSAQGVVLLLDAGLRGKERIVVHPLSNAASTLLAPAGLEAYLRAAGLEPVYVDLEAEPPINKDNPPDLKVYADAAPVLAKDDPSAATPPTGAGAAPAAGAKVPPGGKPAKGGKAAAAKDGVAKPAAGQPRADDVLALTDRLLEQVLAAAGGGAVGLDVAARRQLGADVVMQLNALRNTAYASGYSAATRAIVGSVTRVHQ